MTRLEQIGGEAFRALVAQTGGHVCYADGCYWLAGAWRCSYQLTNAGGPARAHLELATHRVQHVVDARARGESIAHRVGELLQDLREIDPRMMMRRPGFPFGAFAHVDLDTLDSAVASSFGTTRVSLFLWTGERVEAEAPVLAMAVDALEARAREVLQLGPQLRVIQGGAAASSETMRLERSDR